MVMWCVINTVGQSELQRNPETFQVNFHWAYLSEVKMLIG